MNKEFKIGDMVEVVNAGQSFSTYTKFFEEHGLSNELKEMHTESCGNWKNKEKGIVIFIGEHISKARRDRVVYVVKQGDKVLLTTRYGIATAKKRYRLEKSFIANVFKNQFTLSCGDTFKVSGDCGELTLIMTSTSIDYLGEYSDEPLDDVLLSILEGRSCVIV